jgi:hypothetical protein
MFSHQRIKQLATYVMTYPLGGHTLGGAYYDALRKAVAENNLAKVESLILADGYCVDTSWCEYPPSDFVPRYYQQTFVTPLIYAAKNGFFEIASFLLAKGANPNVRADVVGAPAYYQWTPLHYALFYGNYDIAAYLIQECGVTIDDMALNIVKSYGLVNAISFLSEYTSLSDEYIAEVHKMSKFIKAVLWYKSFKGEDNCLHYLSDSYIASIHTIANCPVISVNGCKLPKADIILERAIARGHRDFVVEYLKQPYFTADQINSPLYDINSYEIKDEIKTRLGDLYQKLESDAHTIDEGVCYYDEIPNARKVPIIFIAILSNQWEITEMLIKHQADVNYTVNGVSAWDLMQIVFSDEIYSQAEVSLPRPRF